MYRIITVSILIIVLMLMIYLPQAPCSCVNGPTRTARTGPSAAVRAVSGHTRGRARAAYRAAFVDHAMPTFTARNTCSVAAIIIAARHFGACVPRKPIVVTPITCAARKKGFTTGCAWGPSQTLERPDLIVSCCVKRSFCAL